MTTELPVERTSACRCDFIKLDMSITRDIDSDIASAALAAALVHFGHRAAA